MFTGPLYSATQTLDPWEPTVASFTERSPPRPGKVWQHGGGERHAFQVPPFWSANPLRHFTRRAPFSGFDGTPDKQAHAKGKKKVI